MYVVIVGAGRIGDTLARWLTSAGHEIAVIEEERPKGSSLDEALGAVTILGDGTDAGVLAKAGANRADVLIATTSRDDINLAACQLAKHRFGVSRTISMVNTHDHAALFNLIGIDLAVDVTDMVLGRVQEGLASHGLRHLMPVSDVDSKSLVAIKIPPEAGAEGRPISDISLPDGVVISLVIGRDGSASVPEDGTLIRSGDEVVAVTTTEQEEELRDLLTTGSGQQR